METTRKYLFIGAHPDDIEINAGGTIAKLVSEGHQVSAVVASYSPYSLRGNECVASMKQLGVEDVKLLGLNEPNIELALLIPSLEQEIKRIQPSTVFTHYHQDTHQDHKTVCDATMVAARFIPNVYMYISTYPSGRTNIAPTPNLISVFDEESMQAKENAIQQYHSQKVKYGSENWIASLRAIARGDAWRYGGCHDFAELFQISRTSLL